MQRQFTTTVTLDGTNEKVLLVLRQYLRVCALPGGDIEAGKTPEKAAQRETLEESGFEVKIDQYAGKYDRPLFNDVRFVYRASVTGGQALDSGSETLAARWFQIHSLPKRLSPSVRNIIEDALAAGDEPFEKIQKFPWWQARIMRGLLKLRTVRNRLAARK
jgi:ADP-ribose pyrophosphatase YjhB (NUDIX family)